MKLAILLRGHVRTYKKCFPNLQEILKKFSSDIFIHSWDATDEILNLYKPKDYLIEVNADSNTIKDILKENKRYNSLIPSYKNQIYANYQLTKMMKKYAETNNIAYDFVLFIRFDTIIFTKILLFYFKNLGLKLNKEFTFIPCNFCWINKSIK